jgi:hypothetical protein
MGLQQCVASPHRATGEFRARQKRESHLREIDELPPFVGTVRIRVPLQVDLVVETLAVHVRWRMAGAVWSHGLALVQPGLKVARSLTRQGKRCGSTRALCKGSQAVVGWVRELKRLTN